MGGRLPLVNPMAGGGVAGDVGDPTLVSNITAVAGPDLRGVAPGSCRKVFSGPRDPRRRPEFILTGALFNSVFGGPVFLSPNGVADLPVGLRGPGAVRPGRALPPGAVYDGNPNGGFRSDRIHLSGPTGCSRSSKQDGRGETRLKAAFLPPHGRPGHPACGGYVVGEQKLADGLDVFLRIGYSEEDRSFVSLGVDAGVNFTGPIPGRPDDVVGLGVIYARISRDFANAQPDRALWGHETVVELTYKIAIARWWSLQPDVQYIVHPGGSTATPNAVVVGLRIDLLF
jgi:hypothetical protein